MIHDIKDKLTCDGFAILDPVFTETEIDLLLLTISQADTSLPTFRKTQDLFAIRQFFQAIPETIGQVFNTMLHNILSTLLGTDYFLVKSIYFDKPANSNWLVPYHQDLTISVNKKINLPEFGPWTTKQQQFAVQPPLAILQDNVTLRLHLDDTNEANGALKVIPGSHLKGIYRPETIDWTLETETTCNVQKGGIMLMKPLLLHASGKSTNQHARRVLHMEFSRSALPDDLHWAEYINPFKR